MASAGRKGTGAGPFGEALRRWRDAAKLERAQLDEALEAKGVSISDNYTSMLENGRLKAPERPTCGVIAGILGIEEWSVWDAAARDWAQRAGLDGYVEERIQREVVSDLTDEERVLLHTLRRVAARREVSGERLARIWEQAVRTSDELTAPEVKDGSREAWSTSPLGRLVRALEQLYYLGQWGYTSHQRSMLALLAAYTETTIEETGVRGPFQGPAAGKADAVAASLEEGGELPPEPHSQANRRKTGKGRGPER